MACMEELLWLSLANYYIFVWSYCVADKLSRANELLLFFEFLVHQFV